MGTTITLAIILALINLAASAWKKRQERLAAEAHHRSEAQSQSQRRAPTPRQPAPPVPPAPRAMPTPPPATPVSSTPGSGAQSVTSLVDLITQQLREAGVPIDDPTPTRPPVILREAPREPAREPAREAPPIIREPRPAPAAAPVPARPARPSAPVAPTAPVAPAAARLPFPVIAAAPRSPHATSPIAASPIAAGAITSSNRAPTGRARVSAARCREAIRLGAVLGPPRSLTPFRAGH
ncbi:MAG: hypothetical protein U0625_10130 [Phycisphaerales bacterium]